MQGDVRDRESMLRASQDCDAILHLAAAHHDFGISDETFQTVNVEGTRNVCSVADEHGIETICFYSTVAVYGSQQPPIDESTTPQPESAYGKTKLLAEDVCRRWTEKSTPNRCLVIRPTVIFGPNNFANMFTLIQQIDRGRFLRVGKMENVKSLAYIDNILNATIECWQQSDGPEFEVLNFVDKPDLESWEIVKEIYHGLGRNAPAFSLPYSMARLMALPFDAVISATGRNLPISSARIMKLAKANTRFESDRIHRKISCDMIPLRDGLQEMVRWYRETGKQQPVVDRRPPAS